MNKVRLLQLADHLEHIKDRSAFDMRYWKCGSASCAVGHAADLWPELIGFKKGSFSDGFDYKIFYVPKPEVKGWDVPEKVFDIDYEASQYLFDASSYEDLRTTTPIDVAKRIRAFVETDGFIPEEDWI